MSRILALDLGLSRTRAAIYGETGPQTVPIRGERSIPSTVGFDAGELVAGVRARTAGAESVRLLDALGLDSVTLGGETVPTTDLVEAFLEHVLRGAKASVPDVDGFVVSGRYLTQRERRQLTAAAESIGSTFHRAVCETEAVAFQHSEETDTEANRTVLRLALGASSARAGVIATGGGVYEVLSHTADPKLGGREWDRRLCESFDVAAEGPSRRSVRSAREALDERASVSVSAGTDGTAAPEFDLAREEAKATLEPVLDGICQLAERALDEARVQSADVDVLLLSGRLAQTPFLKEVLRDIVADPSRTSVIAAGAEANALGATVQAGILDGSVDDKVLLDVGPGMFVETDDGSVSLLAANTTIPTVGERYLTTTADSQTVVPLEILSDSFGHERETLFSVLVEGIPEAPAGEVHLQVSFHVDENGVYRTTVGVVDHERRDGGSLASDGSAVTFTQDPDGRATVTDEDGLSVAPLDDATRADVPPVTDATVASVNLGVIEAGNDGRRFTELVRQDDPLPHRGSVSVKPPRTTSGEAELPVFASWPTDGDEVETSVVAKLDVSPLVADGVRRRLDVEMHAEADGDVSVRVSTKRGQSISTTLADAADIDPSRPE